MVDLLQHGITAKTRAALIGLLLAILASTMILGRGAPDSTTVPVAGLQVADRFAADFAAPGGIDSNNAISDGYDTTPALAATITKALQGNAARGAGFSITGPAVNSGAAPKNVTVPTDHGPWHLTVTKINGRWLVAAA